MTWVHRLLELRGNFKTVEFSVKGKGGKGEETEALRGVATGRRWHSKTMAGAALELSLSHPEPPPGW